MDTDVLILEKLATANANVSLNDLAQSLSQIPAADLERALRKLLDGGYIVLSRHSMDHIHISSSGCDYLLAAKKEAKEVTKKRRRYRHKVVFEIVTVLLALIGVVLTLIEILIK